MEKITIRSYEPSDEACLIDFLNLCYGDWGTLQQWEWRYTDYPTFEKDNAFILESNGEIVGHRGLQYRDLIIRQGRGVLTSSLGDTAIHPNYRAAGLYAHLHETTLKAAGAKGACLAFTWNAKGSTTYNRNRKTGFIEITQPVTYIRVTNPAKVLKGGLSDFIHKNEKMRRALYDMSDSLYVGIGNLEFSIGELLGEAERQQNVTRETVKITFDESSLPLLTRFRASTSLQRIGYLARLVLFRKVKIRFGSFNAFVKFIRKGVTLLGHL